MRLLRLVALTALPILGLLPIANAQSFIARWTFDGDSAADLSVTSTLGSVQPAAATLSPLETFGSVADGHTGVSTGWAPAIHDYTAGDYFEFSLSLSAINAYTINSISLFSGSYLNGATGWEVRSDLDNYSMVLGTGVTNGASATSLTNLGLAVDAGDAFTFRIYGTGGSAATFNGFLVDDVTVTGSLSAVPEPSTYALWLGAAGMVGAIGWRRRRAAV